MKFHFIPHVRLSNKYSIFSTQTYFFACKTSGLLPQVLLNVPLSTALLTNGTGLLFLLWYIAPRSAFDQAPKAAVSENLQATSTG
ncbi:hypothetical protein BLX87_01680 [Bacillus sp. VT-16-64]|nr:hypothetical protein BLX87_01680 [Bacillus sp. VT-16-64]